MRVTIGGWRVAGASAAVHLALLLLLAAAAVSAATLEARLLDEAEADADWIIDHQR
jgi:hypothetical protein